MHSRLPMQLFHLGGHAVSCVQESCECRLPVHGLVQTCDIAHSVAKYD